MNHLKKAGIIAGATVGGVIGGTLSVIGKVSDKKMINEIGESIVDSTILTGEIAGNVASGATHFVKGKLKKSPNLVHEGTSDLKEAKNQIIGNVVDNVKVVLNNGEEILTGVKQKDTKKIIRSTKNLAKVILVGAITVGPVKVKTDEQNEGRQ